MGVKLTAEQKADIINQYKSGDKEGALATAKSINSGTTPTTPTPTKTTTTPTQTTPTNQTTPTTYTNKSEYGGQGGIANQKTVPQDNPYVNQGNGQYNYDNKSGYYVSNQPTSSTTSTSDAGARVREEWNKLTYDEQQAKLKENPNLLKGLQKYGAVPKSEGTTETTKQEETPKGDGWDYQDNSPERMMQMSDNVKGFYQTDPRIFQNEDTFRKFFIDGKGRTAEQEQFLMDLYKNMKVYDKYDGMTADNVGNLLARGELPQSYVDYVKNTNPDRYAAIMDAKNKTEDKIKSDAFIDTIKGLEGGTDYTSQTSKVIEWLKGQGLLVDKDGNLIDDRTENYANDEELGYQKQIADLNARNLEIDMTMKNTYDDYREKYPGATKAELMAMAQDTNNDLLREKEDNLVQLTRLQGYVGYMQSERQERNRIGEKAINQLQKQYGMYYDYTPEGMSQLAQAKYAATNVTLDQADNGTDTQKQMALESVLSPIYEQYGAIIQRPMAQVINDVMAYARNNGVSLSDALEQNFMTPLKSKQAYKNIQAQLNATGSNNDIAWTKIGTDAEGNDVYGFVDTTNMTVTPFGDAGGTQDYSYTAEGVSNNRGERQSFMSDIADKYSTIEEMANAIAGNMNGLGDGKLECGGYVNDYIYGVTGEQGKFGNEVSQKESICDNKDKAGVKVGDAIVFNWNKNEPQWVKNSTERADLLKYGHVGYVTGIDDQGNVTMSHTVGGNVTTTTFNLYGNNDYANNFSGSQTVSPKATSGGEGNGVKASYDINVNKGNNATQNKTWAFAQRAWEADEKIRNYERMYSGFRDSPVLKVENRVAGLGGGTAKSKEQKAYETYKNEFVNAVLRRESGAAIGQTEFSDDEKGAIQRYFPQPGDTAEEITLKQKLRENYINNMMSQAGKAADGRTMSEIYQKNKKGNYASEDLDVSLGDGSDFWDWQAVAVSNIGK